MSKQPVRSRRTSKPTHEIVAKMTKKRSRFSILNSVELSEKKTKITT